MKDAFPVRTWCDLSIVLLLLSLGAPSSSAPKAMPSTEHAETLCTLAPAALAARRHELIPGLFQRAERIDDMANGLRFRFANRPGLLIDLARIMEQEQDCCSFLRFELRAEPHAGAITFEVTGKAGTAEMLRKL